MTSGLKQEKEALADTISAAKCSLARGQGNISLLKTYILF
jgi:hypothetical protein